MRLRRISIENFRGIRLATLDLDAITAIIGENGAGKSTFLDALSVCLSGHDDVVRLELRDFHQDENGSTSPSLKIELVFQESEAEWQLPQWNRFAPFVEKAAGSPGDLCLEVRGTRDAALLSSRWLAPSMTAVGIEPRCWSGRGRGRSSLSPSTVISRSRPRTNGERTPFHPS
jgi:Protein of unknown function (DUF2813)